METNSTAHVTLRQNEWKPRLTFSVLEDAELARSVTGSHEPICRSSRSCCLIPSAQCWYSATWRCPVFPPSGSPAGHLRHLHTGGSSRANRLTTTAP
ncbi:uncharacterized [Tachysurus ichikawai]